MSGDIPPEWMSPGQVESWHYAVTFCGGVNPVKDRGLLTAWVVAEDAHRQASQQLGRGLLINVPGVATPQASPYLAIVERQAAIMARLAAELGFSPASRVRTEPEPPVLGKLGRVF